MVNAKVTDYLEVTLEDGIVISDIRDLEVKDIKPDEDKEDMYYLFITNANEIKEIVLSAEDYFLLHDDLGK